VGKIGIDIRGMEGEALCETQYLPGFASLQLYQFFLPDSLLYLEDGGSNLY
jgi:hypothetical protein